MAYRDLTAASELYPQELRYLEELTKEYAQRYPGAGQRLGVGSQDPHVARLLEGVAVLTSGLRAHQEAQFEEFVRNLAEAVCPRLLAPVPSMGIARAIPNPAHFEALAEGAACIPRGARLRDDAGRLFTASTELRLTPFSLVQARFENKRDDRWPDARAALILRLDAGGPVAEVKPDRLPIHLGGDNSALLYELLASCVRDVQFFPVRRDGRVGDLLARGGGVTKAELVPTDAGWGRGDVAPFDGHRLLLEYLALPDRFSFVELSGFARVRAALAARERAAAEKTQVIEVAVLFDRAAPKSVVQLEPSDLALNAVPLVNLFSKRVDLAAAPGRSEHKLVVDANQMGEYEIHSVVEVQADGARVEHVQSPQAGGGPGRSFSLSRRTRQERGLPAGSEMFLSLCDEKGQPVRDADIKVDALVMNRQVEELGGFRNELSLVDARVPARSVEWLRRPTQPRLNLWNGDTAFAALGLMTASLGSLLQGGGAGLRRALEALIHPRFASDRALLKDTIRQISSTAEPRSVREPDGRRAVVRVTVVRLEMTEGAFNAIGGPVLFSAVLHRFLADATPINSVVELVLARSRDPKAMDGVRWPATTGTRALV
jgi:type VI secretion system protein ImpG